MTDPVDTQSVHVVENVADYMESAKSHPERDLAWVKECCLGIVGVIDQITTAGAPGDPGITTILLDAWDAFEDTRVPVREKIEQLIKREIVQRGDMNEIETRVSEEDLDHLMMLKSVFKSAPAMATLYSPEDESAISSRKNQTLARPASP